MTRAEAITIFEIAKTADGGCSVCVGNLLAWLSFRFPQFPWGDWYDADPTPPPEPKGFDSSEFPLARQE